MLYDKLVSTIVTNPTLSRLPDLVKFDYDCSFKFDYEDVFVSNVSLVLNVVRYNMYDTVVGRDKFSDK